MTDLVWGLVVGLAAGGIGVAWLAARLVDRRARRAFEAWLAHGHTRAVQVHVEGHRGAAKEEVGRLLSPRLGSFPFEPADARFLGHPAQLVVFDGYTDVKDRLQDQLREIVFVTLASPGADPSDAALLHECLAAGRVRWSTVRPDRLTLPGPPPRP